MEKRTIEINAKTGAAEKDLKDIIKALDGISDKMDTASNAVQDGFDDMEKGAKDANKSLLSFGSLFKAGGVFALAEKALTFVTDAFKETQFGADLLQVSQEALSRVFNDFFTFIFDNTGSVVNFFKAIFENPAQSVKDFGNAIKANIVERFESFLDTLGYLADAVKKVFEGDFTGALDSVKMAGKESIDVLTGVNDSFDKGAELVTNTAEAVYNYGKEVVTSANNSVKLQREAEKLEAVNMGLIESYDIQAEKLRQVRDDESKSFDERIEANNKLKAVLLEQEKAMKKNAQAIVDAAQARFDATGLQEDEIALIQAKNELSAVEATVTGFMSEQLTNENSLRKEKLELMNELSLIGKSEQERAALEAEQLRDQQIAKIEQEVTDEKLKNELLLAAQLEYSDALQAIEDEKRAADEEEKKAELEREQAVTAAKIDMAGAALGALQGLAKEGSDASKAIAVGQVVLDAYKAIQATFANASINPQTIFNPAYPFIQSAITAVGAFANVRKILAVDPTKEQSASVSQSQSPRGAQAPAFNIVGASPQNQLAEAIGDKEQQPVRAFVVSSEVSNQQALDRNIEQTASIG